MKESPIRLTAKRPLTVPLAGLLSSRLASATAAPASIRSRVSSSVRSKRAASAPSSDHVSGLVVTTPASRSTVTALSASGAVPAISATRSATVGLAPGASPPANLQPPSTPAVYAALRCSAGPPAALVSVSRPSTPPATSDCVTSIHSPTLVSSSPLKNGSGQFVVTPAAAA